MEIHVAYNAKVESQKIHQDCSKEAQKLKSEFNEKNTFFDNQISTLESKITDTLSFSSKGTETVPADSGTQKQGNVEGEQSQQVEQQPSQPQVSDRAKAQADEIAKMRAEVQELKEQQQKLIEDLDTAVTKETEAENDVKAKDNDLKGAYSDNKAEVSEMKQDFESTVKKFSEHKEHQTFAQKGSEIVARLWNSKNITSKVEKEVTSMTSSVNNFTSIGDEAKIVESYTNKKDQMKSDISSFDNRVDTFIEKNKKGGDIFKTGVQVTAGVVTSVVTGGNAAAGVGVSTALGAVFNANEAYKDDNHFSLKDGAKVAGNAVLDAAVGTASAVAGSAVQKVVQNGMQSVVKDFTEGAVEGTLGTIRDLATTRSTNVATTTTNTAISKASGHIPDLATNTVKIAKNFFK